MSIDSAFSPDNFSSIPIAKTSQSGRRKSMDKTRQRLEPVIPPQNADKKQDTSISIIDFFEAETAKLAPATAKSYIWAIDSLRTSILRSNLTSLPFNIDVINQWINDMAINGYTLSTAKYYLNNILSLYRKAITAGLASDNELITEIKSRTNETAAGSENLPDIIDASIIKNLTKVSDSNNSVKLLCDILLFSIYNRGLTLDEIITLRKDSTMPMPRCAIEIAKQWESANRRYIFPLNQGRTTALKIKKDLVSKLSAILSHYSRKTVIFDTQLPKIAWISCALAHGIDATKIIAAIGEKPAVNSALALLPGSKISSHELATITSDVAEYISSNPKRWHAMHLRSRITPADIKERISSHSDGKIEMPAIFYPMESIAKRVGKKLRHETKAVIENVLFFKSADDEIKPLFRIIGDMAWCYKQANTPDSPYATIPDNSMAAFQQMIRQFTPDIEISLHRNRPDMLNRKVRITGGPMAGYEGIISEIVSDGDGSPLTRIFRLEITGSYQIEWMVKIAEAYIQDIQDD